MLGIVLIVIAGLGSVALGSVLAGAASDGTLAVAGFGTLTPPGAIAFAALAAIAVTSLFFVGLTVVLRERRRRDRVVREDRLATEAEREARGRLLEMRLEQLETEVEVLEGRRQVVLHRNLSAVGTSWHLATEESEPEPNLVVVPDPD